MMKRFLFSVFALLLCFAVAAPALAQPLPPGEEVPPADTVEMLTVEGSLTADVPMAWYRFLASAGQEISFRVHADTFDPLATLRGPTGHEWLNDDIEGENTLDAGLAFVLPAGGEYRLGVTTVTGTAGPFTLTATGIDSLQPVEDGQVPPVVTPEDTPPVEQPDEPVPGDRPIVEQTFTGRLEPGDATTTRGAWVDWFAFTAQAGDAVTIRLDGDYDPYLSLIAPDGSEYADDDSGEALNSQLVLDLPLDGDYRIGASSYAPQRRGQYTLTVEGPVTVTAGETPSTTPPSVSPTDDPELPWELEGELAQADARLDDGRFVDWLTVRGEAGTRIRIDLTSDIVDPYLLLEAPDGVRYLDDDGGAGTNSRLEMRLGMSGVYRIGASSFAIGEVGPYLLRVLGMVRTNEQPVPVEPPVEPPVTPPTLQTTWEFEDALQPSDGQRDSGQRVDWYTFTGAPGQTLTIDLTSADLDTYLLLVAPDGTVHLDDDGGEELNSRLVLQLTQAGAYRIGASSFSLAEGPYRLLVTCSAAIQVVPEEGDVPAPPATLGTRDNPYPLVPGAVQYALEATDEQIASGEYFDVFAFEAARGDRVVIEMESDAIDPYLIVRFPSGREEANDDRGMFDRNSRVDRVLTADGEVVVFATSYAAREIGAYLLRLRLTPGTPVVTPGTGTPIAVGESAHGELSTSDAQRANGAYADTYILTLAAGQAVRIDLVADNTSRLDTYLIVQTPEGQELANDDGDTGTLNSDLTFTARSQGIYTIVCSSYRPETLGGYTVRVAESTGTGPGPRPVVSQPGVTFYGIFCGISDYPGFGDLMYCREDAEKLGQACVESGLMDPANMVVLGDSQCTAENVRAAFARFASRVDDDDVFIFFYSGHGNRGPRGDFEEEIDGRQDYLVLYDGEFVDDELNRLLDTIDPEAMKMIAIDACFAGGFRDDIQAPNRVSFFSSEEDMTSLVASEFEAGGYLSLFFRQAIEGGADLNEDGTVSIGELCDFLIVQYVQHVHTGRGGQSRQRLVYDRTTVQSDTTFFRTR